MPKLRAINEPYYAIRQKSSGFFLPPGGKGRKGHTHQEPSATRAPRLFNSLQTANYALRCYTQGKWYNDYYTNLNGEIDGGPDPRKGTERNSKDFEVVEIRFLIGKTNA